LTQYENIDLARKRRETLAEGEEGKVYSQMPKVQGEKRKRLEGEGGSKIERGILEKLLLSSPTRSKSNRLGKRKGHKERIGKESFRRNI